MHCAGNPPRRTHHRKSCSSGNEATISDRCDVEPWALNAVYRSALPACGGISRQDDSSVFDSDHESLFGCDELPERVSWWSEET